LHHYYLPAARLIRSVLLRILKTVIAQTTDALEVLFQRFSILIDATLAGHRLGKIPLPVLKVVEKVSPGASRLRPNPAQLQVIGYQLLCPAL
jgi:hypothetical protein